MLNFLRAANNPSEMARGYSEEKHCRKARGLLRLKTGWTAYTDHASCFATEFLGRRIQRIIT